MIKAKRRRWERSEIEDYYSYGGSGRHSDEKIKTERRIGFLPP